jgi:putative endonuclease
MHHPKRYWVYIMTNNQRSHVLYTGITGNLPRRVWEHKAKMNDGFTGRYNLTRLVWYEEFSHPGDAIAREKEIKGWLRNKKLRLIESENPHWHDLAAEWGRCA